MRLSDDTWALIIPGLMLLTLCIGLGMFLVPTTPVHAQTTVGVGAIGDPCQDARIAKSSAPINISTAATTSLVAVSGTTSVYVCGFSASISQVVTTANTMQFEYGTGAACTGPVVLSGLYGAGGVTAAAPIVVAGGNSGQTIFKAPSGNGICAVTAIGATGSFQGELTFVQQ